MMKRLIVLLWIHILCAQNYSFHNGHSHNVEVQLKSYKQLRDDKIIKQDLDYSCGAASLATILYFYYGKDISEAELLKAMDKGDNKASFEDMAKALQQFGFKAQGFAADFDTLSRLKMPVVVFLKHRRSNHFSVIRGINEAHIWLADPSLGNTTYSKAQFLKMWETREQQEEHSELKGKFLAILPITPQESKQDFFSNNFKRQSEQARQQAKFRKF